jgi:creatinine amidohydrolase
MSILSSYSFYNKTWVEISKYPKEKTVLLLPIGSTEAHGPHLPLSTDSIISQTMASIAADKLTKTGKFALVLPTISYSVTDFSSDFPGSISLGFNTAIAVIKDICVSLFKQGFRYICVANSHLEPEHIKSIETACQKIMMETTMKVCFPDKCRKRWATKLPKEFRSGACHAGSYESSLVMAATPELVKEEIRKTMPANNISLSKAIRAGITTFKEAGGDQAYFGMPAEASVEEGKNSYQILADMLVEAILETYPELS